MKTTSTINRENTTDQVSDAELHSVIADFLAMGHVDNIIAMFRSEPRYYSWVGTLLADERFSVRLGLAVLFEYLVPERPQETALAVPSLEEQLSNPTDWIRGEAVNLLGIIGTREALALVRTMRNDSSPQVVEIACDILEAENNGPNP